VSASPDKWQLKERELEAPDELAVWIPKVGGVRDLGHTCSLAQDLRRHS
jgi:hypothetical protein